MKEGLSRVVGDEVFRVLHELGLTGYESAAYLSLIERGVMTASKISESTDVPFSKVYEVLNGLVRKGWIDVERGRPSRYFARSPVEAFESVRHALDEKVQGWERIVAGELQLLYDKREFREKPDIWILRGEKSVLRKLQEMLAHARKQVMIAAPRFARVLAEKSLPSISGLRLGEVEVLVMVGGSFEDWNLKGLTGVADIRRRDNLFGGGVIVDGAEALLVLGEEQKPSLVVWSNHLGLVKFAKDYFQYLWDSSDESGSSRIDS